MYVSRLIFLDLMPTLRFIKAINLFHVFDNLRDVLLLLDKETVNLWLVKFPLVHWPRSCDCLGPGHLCSWTRVMAMGWMSEEVRNFARRQCFKCFSGAEMNRECVEAIWACCGTENQQASGLGRASGLIWT